MEISNDHVTVAIASIPKPEVASISALMAWARSVSPQYGVSAFNAGRFEGPSAASLARGIVDKLFSEELSNCGVSAGGSGGYTLERDVQVPDLVFYHLIDKRTMFSM